MKTPNLLVAFIVGLVLSAGLSASDTRYVGEDEVPTPLEVARALAGADFQPRLRRRGISMDHPNAPAPVMLASATPTASPAAESARPVAAMPDRPVEPSSTALGAAHGGGTLAVAIAFEFNSAALQPQAQRQLDSIAEGLKLLDRAAIQIEGHTDSVGAAGYNQHLSERRAEAVRRYLVEQHDLPAASLLIRGWGMSRPIPGLSPSAAQNRRVEFSLH